MRMMRKLLWLLTIRRWLQFVHLRNESVKPSLGDSAFGSNVAIVRSMETVCVPCVLSGRRLELPEVVARLNDGRDLLVALGNVNGYMCIFLHFALLSKSLEVDS